MLPLWTMLCSHEPLGISLLGYTSHYGHQVSDMLSFRLWCADFSADYGEGSQSVRNLREVMYQGGTELINN